MPRTGRPPKPVELKRMLGNPGKRPLPEPVTVIAAVTSPVPPDEPQNGTELLEALLDAGAGNWNGVTDQLAMWRLIRDGWDRRIYLMGYLAENGHSYESKGRWYARPEASELEVLEKNLTTWLSLSGLEASSRGRIGVAAVKARSKLEEMRERRRAGRPAG